MLVARAYPGDDELEMAKEMLKLEAPKYRE
jgi:hypothetical protein